MKKSLIALAVLALTSVLVWAGSTTTYDGSVAATGDLTAGANLVVTDSLYVGGNATVGGSVALTGDLTMANVTCDDLDTTTAQVDTLKPGTGTGFYLRANDGQDDAVFNTFDVEATSDIGAATGTFSGEVTSANFNGTIAELDTLKPGSGVEFYLRANDGHNDANLNCATFAGALTGDVTGSAAGALGNFTMVEADTLCPGSGANFYIRAIDGHNDAVVYAATFAGALTGAVTGDVGGDLTGDVDAAIVEVDTLKPGSGVDFEFRANDGHDDANVKCATFTGALTGDVTGSAAGALGDFTMVEADTLCPGSGVEFYLRANDGHNDANLNCATFTGGLTGDVAGNLNATVAEADTFKPGSGVDVEFRANDGHDDANLKCATFAGALTGKVTGDVDATIVEADTLKPGSGTAFNLRASDGHNDADLNCANFSGNLDGTIVEADTLKPGSGTAFELRASDGQDDADLNVYDVSATNDVSAATLTGDLTGDVDAAIAEVDTLKPGSGTAFSLRASDGQNDADLNCFAFSGNLDATTAEADTFKPGSGVDIEFRANDGHNDANVKCATFTGALTGKVTGDVDAAIVEADTLKPGSGTAFSLRASDGQNDADLNVYDVSATNEVSAANGDFTISESDTIKPGSGTAVNVRAIDGQNDADLNVYDVSATNDVSGATITGDLTGDVDAAIAEVDTLKPGSGTAFSLRASDGQNDADLNVYNVSATNDVSGVTLTGALIGPAANSVQYKGKLPTASEHTGELYRNTTGDSLWYANNSTWTQLVPHV